MKTAEKGIREFIAGKPLTVNITEMDQPDVFLWAIWAMQQYAKSAGDDKCLATYGELVKDIITYIIAGKHPNLSLDTNGLVSTDGHDKPVTWMNSTVNGRPVVPRTGYIVEFNALWYNALKFGAKLAALKGDNEKTEDWEKRAELCKQSFIETFLNDYGYLLIM